jgi:hypothetical protein
LRREDVDFLLDVIRQLGRSMTGLGGALAG